MGQNVQAYINIGGKLQGYFDRLGARSAAILPYIEQSSAYNAVNITLGPYQFAEQHRLRLRDLDPLVPQRRQRSRASGSSRPHAGWDGTTIGITYYELRRDDGHEHARATTAARAQLAGENGMFPDIGMPTFVGPGNASQPPVRIAGVTDGSSNTILFGEKAQGKYEQVACGPGGGCNFEGNGWWADADFADTTMSSFYPINPTFPNDLPRHELRPELRPGRTRSPWPRRASIPAGATSPSPTARSGSSRARSRPGTTSRSPRTRTACPCSTGTSGGNGVVPGVYQALSTRAGGEVISSDNYSPGAAVGRYASSARAGSVLSLSSDRGRIVYLREWAAVSVATGVAAGSPQRRGRTFGWPSGRRPPHPMEFGWTAHHEHVRHPAGFARLRPPARDGGGGRLGRLPDVVVARRPMAQLHGGPRLRAGRAPAGLVVRCRARRAGNP